MPVRRYAASVMALSTLAPLTVAALTQSAPATAADPDATLQPTTISIQLSAPDPARLAAVAARPIKDRDTRLARLTDLVPGDDQHAEVTTRLLATGYTIDATTTWSITATAPRRIVDRDFGTTVPTDSAPPDSAADSADSADSVVDAPLPDVPAALADDVTAAYPLDGSDAVHPLTPALTGADVRNADTPAGTAASAGTQDAGLTIATLQFATWQQNDLSTYAANSGLPDPVATGQYRAVTVDGGPTDGNGAAEVALDQESLLSVAPTARQAAYFAPNRTSGFIDAVAAVYDDVTSGVKATAADPHIAALSISWGGCETGWGSASISLLQNRLAALTAAGVTIFAASGDSGIYDCRSGTSRQPDVDFPASSPSVVAVGGTRLSTAGASAPNAGSNWTETGWSCATANACVSAQGGTGGGVSGSAYRHGGTNTASDFAGFPAPAWQQGYVTDSPFAGAANRMVPDIAADGDPASGFLIYSSSGSQPGWATYGGTSLGAPLSAGQLVDTLGDAGVTTGVGDIHTALYHAYAETRGFAVTDPNRVFRDVVVGSNGAAADRGLDPSTSAGTGYDTVSGLGGVLWAALRPYLGLPYYPIVVPTGAGSVSSTPTPTSGSGPGATGGAAVSRVNTSAHLAVRLVGHGKGRTSRLVAQWSASVTGGHLSRVQVRLTCQGHLVYTGASHRGSTQTAVRPGATYVLKVVGTDSAGHVASRRVHFTAPQH